MSSVQPDLEQLSLWLSEVLDDIGVDDKMIRKRRQAALFKESTFHVRDLIDKTSNCKYIFGSMSEGTATRGISSDEDILFCLSWFNVINDCSFWIHGRQNLLLVQDKTTAPGYCVLQLLRSDVCLPAEYIPNDNYCIDDKGRVLLKNTIFQTLPDRVGMVQHGPAIMFPLNEIMQERDAVVSFHCAQWPIEARQWLKRENIDGWPNASLKSDIEKCGCFLVPLDSKVSGLDEVEWRISTISAERHLMFSLNNIHLKCYVMMKILLKSYDVFQDVISSYICKTTLLYCVENTKFDFWQDRNLITCLNKLLSELYNYIEHVNCPRFIIPENNLMAGKISPLQQQRLLEVLAHIIRSEGKIFLDIQVDGIGEILRQKFYRSPKHSSDIESILLMQQSHVSGELSYGTAYCITGNFITYFNTYCQNNCETTIRQFICKYQDIRNIYPQLNNLQQKAANCLSSLMCTAIGSLMASNYISIHKRIPDRAIEWLTSGLDSDVSSGWLKLATVYYSVGDMNKTEELLTRIDQRYDRNVVMPVCKCKVGGMELKEGFCIAAYTGEVTDFRHTVSYCVMFMYNEVTIVPQELRQEFFRSSQEELRRRGQTNYYWKKFAVVDSLPYLYFLQYKTYRSLGKNEEKERALNKLRNVMIEETRLKHTETVLNLLGQCMEQENLLNDALHCYEKSLQERHQNNAANYHRSRVQCKRLAERVFGRRTWAKWCLFVCLHGCVRGLHWCQQFFSPTIRRIVGLSYAVVRRRQCNTS